jgi:outer membrane protein
MKSLNTYLLTAVWLITFTNAQSQSILDGYLDEALRSNITLQQKNISLQQAEQSLGIAKSYFLPTVSLMADYTHGRGGRSIQLPIGDLLNPVYASLNQLTQSDEFPTVENMEQNFFPRNFYDARVRTSLPLINTDLIINRKITSQQVMLKGYEVEAYKRQLVLDVKTAYYNYLSAIAAVKTYESAVELVSKNKEVNESLLRNGKNIPANVLRSKSEVERVNADLNSARSRVSNARRYFNFLLNRGLDTDVLVDEDIPLPDFQIEQVSIADREEIQLLKSAIDVQESAVQLNRLSRLPKVNAFIDFGSQASDWVLNSSARYYLAGVQLTVPIFQGFRNNVQVRKSRLDVQKSNFDLQQAEAQFQVSAEVAHENFKTTRQNHDAAIEQVKSARSYFTLIDKGYQQGVNSLIEFIDARNQLTSSELQLNLRQYEMLTAAAQLERETSSFNLPK